MLCCKIVEKTENGYKYLFHERKKVFNVGDSLTAIKKMAYEAYDKKTGEKKLYLSGIHVVESLDQCLTYLKRFKNKSNKAILEVEAFGTIKKEGGRAGVLLADKITIIKEIAWNLEK